MRLFPIALLALLSTSCTSVPRGGVAPSAEWLAGHWCLDGASNYAGVAIGLRPVRFNPDGTYFGFEDSGRWELDGPRLTMNHEGAIRTVRTDQIERLGPGEMAWTMAFGEREIWRRCPERS